MRKTKKLIVSKIKNTGFYYGWIITAITFLSFLFSGPGQTYFISTFIDSYILEFGWSRSTVSSFYSIATLISGLSLFMVGRLTDKYGKKKILLIVATLLGAICLWNSFIAALWMLFIGFFGGRILGQGSMTLIPSTILPNWFIKKRALAFSLMSIGGVVGSAIVPPVNTMLIKNIGWNNTWRVWGVLLWILFLPLVYLFLYDKPKNIGLLPDNESKNNTVKGPVKKVDNTKPSWTVKEAMSTKTFWFMLLCQINLPMIGTGITFHFISIMGVAGISPSKASFILSLIAIVAFPSTFLAGFILDRVKMKYAAAFISLLLLVGIIILMNNKSIYTSIVFAVIQGLAMGFNSVFSNLLWPNYFGTKHLGSIKGAIMTAVVIGAALGPLFLGISYDLFNGYTNAFIFLMLFPSAGIIAALLSNAPLKNIKTKEPTVKL